MGGDTGGIFLSEFKYVMCFRNIGFNSCIHLFIYFLFMFSVRGFSNFVFRVLVFRRSGVPAFRHSGVPCFSTSR